MADKIDKLLKTDGSDSECVDSVDNLSSSRRRIKSICDALCLETKTYKPSKTVNTIKNYLESKESKDRILYSEITNYVYALDDEKQGKILTNIENLLSYSIDNDAVSEDCKKIVIKLYDHILLAIRQKSMTLDSQEKVQHLLLEHIGTAKAEIIRDLSTDTKKIEKEYITILGIFASIVFAFIGGITFSTSVLQNIDAVNIYRLLLTVDLLGVILINTMYILIKFLCHINEKNTDFFSLRKCNIIFILFGILIIVAWLFDVGSLASLLSDLVPWK